MNPAPIPMNPRPMNPAPMPMQPMEQPRIALGTPKVDSYDVDIHLVQVGDSYRSISQRYYLEEGYAQSLRQYNLDTAPDALESPDRMQPGKTRLGIPPIRVLRQKYPQMVPGVNGAPVVNVSNPLQSPMTGQVAFGSPQNLNPTSAFREYRVPEPGQTLREVARTTMGSGEYWRKIFDLNTRLNPQERLAPGTILRLPADANYATP